MMNGRHLPAGQQNMPQDMRGRRQYAQHQPAVYPPIASGAMYNNGYMNPYGMNAAPNAGYYPGPQLPPQYYQQYGYPPPRPPHTPPSMPLYARPPPPPQPYPRPQPSPAISASHQAPPAPIVASTAILGTPLPTTPGTIASFPASSPMQEQAQETPIPPFIAPLPWIVSSDGEFPARRTRRRRRQAMDASEENVQLPANPADPIIPNDVRDQEPTSEEQIARPETPSSTHPTSDQDSTHPTTPSSQHNSSLPAHGEITLVAKPTSAKPIVPAIPKSLPKEASSRPSSAKAEESQQSPAINVAEIEAEPSLAAYEEAVLEEVKAAPIQNAWSKPKVWSTVLASGAKPVRAASNESPSAGSSTVGKTNVEILTEALKSFDAISNDSKVTFLEPRGLANAGNMCYMNSVLQVLIFCAPFFNFLDQVGKHFVHSPKSDTPLIDAMIMFKEEYKVIDSATTVEKLRLRLKDSELEQYGQPFTPEFVYEAMKALPRFRNMQRGHQQDAEEFLGLLLDGLHDECVSAMQSSSSNATPTNGPASPVSDFASVVSSATGNENGWQEVGPKQKASVTRSSGTITTESPVTKTFTGVTRSVLKKPGEKDSVTLTPYHTLQLDIGAPEIHSILDALKGLTRKENVQVESPGGNKIQGVKQDFIEKLPPVLILHLKRFKYDNTGGAQKIWKKVGYPLELEIPKELFTRSERNTRGAPPKYRLTAVVYHHGKNASAGHYTVDVRRQDGREWIRLDDRDIKRIRNEDVAEGGSQVEPAVLAAVLDAHNKDMSSSGNAFAAIDDGGEGLEEGNGWKRASGSGKKWSSVANGASTPKGKADSNFSVKDAKVAYILFYQKI